MTYLHLNAGLPYRRLCKSNVSTARPHNPKPHDGDFNQLLGHPTMLHSAKLRI